MYKKLNRVVDKYNNNDFSYKGTCSILRMIRNGTCTEEDAASFNFDVHCWNDVKESSRNICSCITQGLYCGEYQLNCIEGEVRDCSNFALFAENWKNGVEDANVKIRVIKLEPEDISSKWKVVNPIAPPQEMNDAINQSEAQQLLIKYRRKGIKLFQNRRLKGIWERFIQGLYDGDETYKYNSGIRGKRVIQVRNISISQSSSQQTNVRSQTSP